MTASSASLVSNSQTHEVRVPSWDFFRQVVDRLVVPAPPTWQGYVFRGQSRSEWELRPSLLRYFLKPPTLPALLAVESHALREFKTQAHLYLPASRVPDFSGASIVEWWALMQHYQAPTRLLDWTFSGFVAAYFAVAADVDADGVVFVLQGPSVTKPFRAKFGADALISDEQFQSVDAGHFLMPWTAGRRSERQVAQQGTFVLSLNATTDFDRFINATCVQAIQESPGVVFFKKFIIPAALKPQFMRHLRAMNITAQSLFPGTDGLGKGVAEIVRLYAGIDAKHFEAFPEVAPDANYLADFEGRWHSSNKT